MDKLVLYYPIKPYVVGQGFGANHACINRTTKQVIMKVNNVCPPNTTDFYLSMGLKGHNGLDTNATDGQPCYHAGPDGVVQELQTEPARGLGIGIVTKDKFDLGENGIHFVKLRYWHLKSFNVIMGEEVKTGELIGWCDNTGFSSGSHLHFEMKAVEYDANGILYNVFQSNGYFGSVNPERFFKSYFAQDWDIIIKNLREQVTILQKIILWIKKNVLIVK